jgi:hypothetical protein
MSKKSRRARAKIRGVAPVVQRTDVGQVQAKAPAGRANQAAQASAGASASVIKPHQYDYVGSDLIHVGIIAGSLILILIILTFVLR